MLPFLEQVYEASHAARTIARDFGSGDRYPFALGVTDALDRSRLVGPIREVRNSAPGLELRFEAGPDVALVERLRAGALDLAILESSVVDAERMRFNALFTETMAVLLPAQDPLAGKETLSVSDLSDRDFVELVDSRAHDAFAAATADRSPGLVRRHAAARPSEAQLLISSGLGFALVDDHEPLLPGLDRRPVSTPVLTRTIGIAQMRGRPASTAALTLSRLMRAQSYCPSGPASP